MKHKLINGFTMVELLIVIVIIAIIASIALPSYEQFMREGRRADAKNMIMQMAALQERFYADNGFYSTMNNLAGADPVPSDKGYYNISVTCAPDCLPASRPQTYTLTATPPAGGAQVADTECGNYTYNQAGAKGASGAGTPEEIEKCW